MSSENGERTFKLKLKLTAPLVRHATSRQGDGDADVRLVVAPMDTNPDKPLHIGARGGAALKELLATAPNPEEAIREYQATHGLNFATKTVNKRHGEADANGSNKKPRAETVARFAPAEKLLDLLQVSRSTVYESLLDKLLKEMLLRIEELSQDELQRMLEVTFPYIEFRELRKIPIAILARQDDTPEAYLRELTENRRILGELPIHVRRKIMHVDKQELQYFVEQCTQEYITETLDWYLKHPTLPVASTATSTSSSSSSTVSTARKSFSMESQLSFGRSTSNGAASNSNDLWNVTSHMPSPSSRSSTQTATEDRRRQSAALAALSDMIGDSDALYLSTLDILQEYVVTANIPGTVATASAKDYVDYVPFLGALRSDLANLQRDKTTTQMRTDPLHKFIWFLDRAVKHPNAMEVSQLHELLSVIKKLRVGDVPLNKKFKKKSDVQEEEDNFEIVLGPPPVDQLLVVLDKIAKTDVRVIFAEPVPDDVPGYRDIIKEPMDLSTMRKKAKKGKYKTLEMFTDDFNLMIKNCMTFNPDTTVFYKDGKRIGKRGLEIIEKHATTLRGEPQRIRAKKRKKSGPAETMTMLTSAGVVTLKDFGDFDQTGMVPEGICDEALADVALILSDPHVKQMLCDSLLKTLVVCWQKRELPTDNLMCRGLVQLLQVGNPASVRRMLRKKDYVLRAPQVVTMRVVLPLLIRSMATYRIGFSGTGFGAITSKALKEDLVEATLWTNMLRASSTIRSVTKAFVLQSLKDHQVDVAVHLLELLKFVEDEILYRDRVFLHAVGEIGLQDVKTYSSSSDLDTAPMTSNGGGFESLKTSSVWKSVVEGFFISSLRTRTLAAKESNGSIIEYEELDDGDEAEPSKDEATVTKHQAVRSFPLPILHEKAAMVLSSAVLTLEKNGSIVDARVVGTYLRRTLGVTRAACLSLDEFEMLWRSQVFQQCRSFYEPLLSRCPDLSKEIFSAEYCPTSQDEEEEKADVKPKIEPTAGNEGAARNPSMTGGEEEELEAGEVDEEEGAVEDDT